MVYQDTTPRTAILFVCFTAIYWAWLTVGHKLLGMWSLAAAIVWLIVLLWAMRKAYVGPLLLNGKKFGAAVVAGLVIGGVAGPVGAWFLTLGIAVMLGYLFIKRPA